ncbi:MAG: transposase [Candidatus Euphemobacter frigidus]|nr:transposase [Candidatus Euphemobacter frigidus]
MLRGWKHSGFNLHRSRRVTPDEGEDRERLAQYIIRSPFSTEKMRVTDPGGSIVYRSEMNPKIKRNFEVFSPTDFIAAITQHIPDKNFQLVRYYGWYSNKMRGQREKRAGEHGEREGSPAVEVIDISEHQPRRRPSKKWRELIRKVWEADPLLCPNCGREMRIVALINERDVIERILRHLGLWSADSSDRPARDPPFEVFIKNSSDPWLEDDPFPDSDDEPVIMAS